MSAQLILKQAMQKISAATSICDLSEISRLSRIAERAKEIQSKQQKLDNELAALAIELDHPGPVPSTVSDNSRSSPQADSTTPARVSSEPLLLLGPIAVSIDWSAIGKPPLKQTICERTGADTLRAFFEAIHEQFGPETLARLVAVRANRAPLLSQRPETEFLNPKQGVCYQHQKIGSTDWYVLTHSSTPEKLGIIRQVAHALRFPPGSVTVQEVDMKQQLEKLMNL